MLRYMVDTDICVFVLRNRPAELRQKFHQFAEELCISTITVGELFYGVERSAQRPGNRRAVEEFIAGLVVLPFAIRAAAHFAQLRAELTGAGAPCGAYDMLIAGHARSEDLIVVTNNIREFARVPGLMVENWL